MYNEHYCVGGKEIIKSLHHITYNKKKTNKLCDTLLLYQTVSVFIQNILFRHTFMLLVCALNSLLTFSNIFIVRLVHVGIGGCNVTSASLATLRNLMDCYLAFP